MCTELPQAHGLWRPVLSRPNHYYCHYSYTYSVEGVRYTKIERHQREIPSFLYLWCRQRKQTSFVPDRASEWQCQAQARAVALVMSNLTDYKSNLHFSSFWFCRCLLKILNYQKYHTIRYIRQLRFRNFIYFFICWFICITFHGGWLNKLFKRKWVLIIVFSSSFRHVYWIGACSMSASVQISRPRNA